MKFTFLLTFSILVAVLVNAQDKYVLYYPDNTKMFEGKMLFSGAEGSYSKDLVWIIETGAEQKAITNRMERDVLSRYNLDQLFTVTQLDGNCRLYYKNGKLMISQEFSHGIANGMYEEYFPNGGKAIVCGYKNGMLNGTFIYYSTKGKVIFEGEFEAYTQEEIAVFYKNKKPIDGAKHDLVNTYAAAYSFYQFFLESEQTKLNGRYAFYFDNGSKQAILQYKNFLRDGIWELWDLSGEMTNRVEFENGVLVYVYDSGRKFTIEEYKEQLDLKKVEEESRPVEK